MQNTVHLLLKPWPEALETKPHSIHKRSFIRLHEICLHLPSWLLCTQCVDCDCILMGLCVKTEAQGLMSVEIQVRMQRQLVEITLLSTLSIMYTDG